MPLLTGRQQVFIKSEAVAGTPQALVAANHVLHTGVAEFDAGGVEMTPREAMTSSLSKRGAVPGVRSAKIRFKCYARGTTGAPATGVNAGDFEVPLMACGVLGADSGVGPNEIITYKPSSTHISDETSGAYSTVALYQDGKIYKIHGAVGNCKITLAVGAPMLMEFEFTGVYNAPIDGALLVPTYSAIIEPAFLDASVTVLGLATARIKTLTLDLGNEVSMRPNPNATTGLFTAQIVRRNPTGTIDPEEALAATKNYWAEFIAGTLGSITTGTWPSGGTNYNMFNLTIPNAQYNSVGLADRDGVANAPINFLALANSDAGDDEWSLVQT
jgi:hypothetical protein